MITLLASALLLFGSCSADPVPEEKCSIVRNKMFVCIDSTVESIPSAVNKEIEWLVFTTSNVPVLMKKHLESFPSLTDVHLKEAKLETVEDDAFAATKDLSWVDFSINKLTRISPNLFQNNPDVYYFNVSFNPNLVVPKDEPFLHAPQIKWLLLQGCGIKELYSETFTKLSGVKFLTLSDNELRSLPNDLLQPLKHLSSLDLSRNHLKNINIETPSPRSLYLYLGDNPWQCDCNLFPTIEWAKQSRIKLKDEARCANLENKKWDEIASMDCPAVPAN